MTHDQASTTTQNPMDMLMAKLSEQQATLNKHNTVPLLADDATRGQASSTYEFTSKSATTTATSSISVTPVTNSAEDTASASSVDNVEIAAETPTPKPTKEEVLRLKIELEKARGKIARMDQELTQTRITKHTIEQAIGGTSESDYPMNQPVDNADHRLGAVQNAMNFQSRPQFMQDGNWAGQDDNESNHSDAMSTSQFSMRGGEFRGGPMAPIGPGGPFWGNSGRAPYPNFGPGIQGGMQGFQGSNNGFPGNAWMGRGMQLPFHDEGSSYNQGMPNFRPDRGAPDLDNMANGLSRGGYRGRFMGRGNNSFPYTGSNSSYDGMAPPNTYGSVAGMGGGVGNSMGGPMSMGSGMNYQPQPIGTPLSPFAPEFTSLGGQQWKNDVSSRALGSRIPPTGPKALLTGTKAVAVEGQTFLPTTEPLNYRRLLDRTVNCNWKYIVDKIVCNNDQQASIFLQQKLKVGTTEQKYDIVEAIVAQAYPLMVNRFGNFLVQRCFEHGTPEQVIKIAEAIRGNTLNLSMDAFGCHVVQKAFDSVPEDYKAIMVHELLRRIPETVIHRYACHVWQKLFELRWTESPPQIMKYVNEALRGMWHEVALGETGSLVVQNIFENCLEEDKVCSFSHTLTHPYNIF